MAKLLTSAAIVAATVALLTRHAFYQPQIGVDASIMFQIAALTAWWLLRYRTIQIITGKEHLPRRLLPEAVLSIFVPLAVWWRGSNDLTGLEAFTLLAAGSLLLDAAAEITRRLTSSETRLREVMRIGLATWLTLVVIGTVLLALPAATHPAVPDFAHNPWRHITACAFMSTSAVSLCGATIYSPGEDLRFFGQAVLYALIQAGGWLFIVLGIAALRPWLAGRVCARSVLLTWVGLQFVAVWWSLEAWKPVSATNVPTWWPAVFHAASAMNQSALSLRQDGLASYLRIGTVYWPMLALSVLGSIGLPIVCERARALRDVAGRKLNNEKNTPAFPLPRLREYCSLELHATIWILCIGAVLLWMMESPMVASTLGSSRPVYLGVHQTTLADMGPGDRWRASLLLSAEARSGGLHVVPLSEGALKWPTWGLLLTLMLLGGAVGSASGGVRTGTVALLLIRNATESIAGRAARQWLWIILLSIPGMMLLAAGWLRICQPEWGLWELGLHAASYVAGVGWTTGLTPHLTVAARLGMIVFMAAGKLLPVLAWCALTTTLFAAAPARPIRKGG